MVGGCQSQASISATLHRYRSTSQDSTAKRMASFAAEGHSKTRAMCARDASGITSDARLRRTGHPK